MPRTQVRGSQVLDHDISKDNMDTTTPGGAVITKVIAGEGVSISSTGVDPGTGDVTINAGGVALLIHSLEEKFDLGINDVFVIEDASSGWAKKRVTVSTLIAGLFNINIDGGDATTVATAWLDGGGAASIYQGAAFDGGSSIGIYFMAPQQELILDGGGA